MKYPGLLQVRVRKQRFSRSRCGVCGLARSNATSGWMSQIHDGREIDICGTCMQVPGALRTLQLSARPEVS